MDKDIEKRDHIEILVVEDSPTQAEELKFILEKRGFEVSVASHGKAALAFLRTHKPDIVITDIIMPEMDGYELCRQMGLDPSLADIPVILVTALSDPTNVLRGIEVGANNFITKPYDEGHLVSRIGYLIANKGLREESPAASGINVVLSGQTYHITADRPQILDLLLSTYENADRQNRELLEAQKELRELNDRLEETILERDAEITERKKMEVELQRARDELEDRVEERTAEVKQLADLLNLTHDTVFVRDTRDRITYWNKGAEETYGWGQKEVLGKVPHILLRTRVPESIESMKASLMNKDRWEGELVQAKRDGTEIVVASRQVLRRGETGKPLDVLEINIDITAQKHAEAQLRQAHKMEALGTLTGGIAHDFNNILGAMIGFTELAQERALKGSLQEHHLRRVMEAGLRGRELVKQMLTFSRRTEQKKDLLQLSSIVKESMKLLGASIPSTINIRVKVDGGSGLVLADPTQMQQVLMNLCTNAAHAMLEKGGTLDVELSGVTVPPSDGNSHAVAPGLYMKLVVRDTGAGISPDIMGKLFDPFFTTKKLGEGTGLGLSVVDGIVKQHNGYITVASEPGKGSAFTVYLPRAAEAAPTETVRDDAIPTGHEKVLFVDDEEALVEMGQELVEGLGYRVTARTSSIDALATLKADPAAYDLIITDQTMPDMTGLELAEAALAVRRDIPVILCTGFSHIVNADRARAAGIRAFAMKPLTRRELAETIRKVLDE
ncbi:MAG: response regulator [Syntrophorhabdales bacterium]|jgi:PAS domain S-box-containing protein